MHTEQIMTECDREQGVLFSSKIFGTRLKQCDRNRFESVANSAHAFLKRNNVVQGRITGSARCRLENLIKEDVMKHDKRVGAPIASPAEQERKKTHKPDHLSKSGAMRLAKRLQKYWHDLGYPAARFWAEPIAERFAKVGTYEIYRVACNLVNALPPRYRED